MSLRKRSMLVTLNMHQWTGQKLDHKVSHEVCDAYGTNSNAGNFKKNLVPKHHLKAIAQQVSKTRSWFYNNTLPWQHGGFGMLSGKNFLKFTKEYNNHKDRFWVLVEQFLTEYDKLKDNAAIELQGLFNERDYPPVEVIRKKFAFEHIIIPMPDTYDPRLNIPEEELATLAAANEVLTKQADEAAHKEVYTRLYTALAKFVLILRQPDQVFKNTTVLNLLEISKKVPDLILKDDHELVSAANNTFKIMDDLDIKRVRKYDDYRQLRADFLKPLDFDWTCWYSGKNTAILSRRERGG